MTTVSGREKDIDRRAQIFYAEVCSALVGLFFRIPRGPYAGRWAKVESVSIDCGRVSLWVLIERADEVGWLNNEGARRWQSWRLSEVAELLS